MARRHELFQTRFLMLRALLLLCGFLLSACAAERCYRGVSEPVWQQLSAEQKQLIVDRSYHEDFPKG